MGILDEKARKYFIAGVIAERTSDFDVASTNYFKSLAAIGDFVLSKINLFPKNHDERFQMLRENYSQLYKMTSSLFLTYRKAYSKEISKYETLSLKEKLKEAFKNAGIEIPTDKEVDEHIKKALKG